MKVTDSKEGTLVLAQAAALQTENAFYYSYYNELVEAEGFVAGLQAPVGIGARGPPESPGSCPRLRRLDFPPDERESPRSFASVPSAVSWNGD